MSDIQKQTFDSQAIQKKIYTMFNDTEWQSKLKMFMLSSDFKDIIDNLIEEVSNDRRFTPPLKVAFNGIINCPYDKLKVVMIGQDPYPKLGVADGIAFSCSFNEKPQPSLKMFHAALKDYIPDYEPFNDLTPWVDQGILMLNTAFTTQIGKPGTHQKIWQNFTAEILNHLSKAKPDLIYVFFGKKAQEWEDFVPSTATKITVVHPAAAVYTGGVWNHKDVFPKISAAVKEKFDYDIEW